MLYSNHPRPLQACSCSHKATRCACNEWCTPQGSRGMAAKDFDLASALNAALQAGELIASAAENIQKLLKASRSAVDEASVVELARARQWSELNDRFYKRLAFGTGGLRGRTIGKIVTSAERGAAGQNERPEFPCVG